MMPRKPRSQVAGATYHVTTHAVAGLFVFGDPRFCTKFLAILATASAKYGVHVRSYCLMGTHYHLLVTTPEPNIARFMQYVNGVYARWFNREHGRRGHVWDARYGGE